LPTSISLFFHSFLHSIIQSAEFVREMNCGGVVVRFGLWVVALSIAGYIVGPPLYWHLIELINHSSSSCTPCVCDCSSQPIISIPQGIYFPSNSIPPLLPFSFFCIQNLQNNCFHHSCASNLDLLLLLLFFISLLLLLLG